VAFLAFYDFAIHIPGLTRACLKTVESALGVPIENVFVSNRGVPVGASRGPKKF
jgi:hypothetical protein